MHRPKIAFYTLGCKVNQNDTEALEALFIEEGYRVVDFAREADIYLINTCTVTHMSDRKSRQIIRRAIKMNPRALIVVAGCYAQISSKEIKKIDGVDIIIGTSERSKIVEIVKSHKKGTPAKSYIQNIMLVKEFEELPIEKSIQRTRAYLKVQEGCQQFCSYCIIPYTRGPLKSRNIQNTIDEVNLLVKQGFREIVLTGIHLGAFGEEQRDTSKNLTHLCRAILERTEIRRLRLGSLEPTEVTDEMIQLMVDNPRFCRHLHLPLQNGDDEVLRRMNRPYDTAEYRQIVQDIRGRVSEIGLTTDIMVGFPGETENNFQNSLDFVAEMGFSGLHVFKYSPRQGTPAASFRNQVAPQIKENRSKAMLALGQASFQNFAQGFVGQVWEVLVEGPSSEGGWEGHTDNYLRIVWPENSLSGVFVKVLLEDVQDNYLVGKLV